MASLVETNIRPPEVEVSNLFIFLLYVFLSKTYLVILSSAALLNKVYGSALLTNVLGSGTPEITLVAAALLK
jgi:hypothetical protein